MMRAGRRLGPQDGERTRAPRGEQARNGVEEDAPQPQHRGKAGQQKKEGGQNGRFTECSADQDQVVNQGQRQRNAQQEAHAGGEGRSICSQQKRSGGHGSLQGLRPGGGDAQGIQHHDQDDPRYGEQGPPHEQNVLVRFGRHGCEMKKAEARWLRWTQTSALPPGRGFLKGSGESLHDDGGVMPPETEGVAQDGVHFGLAGLVGHAIQVAFRVLVVHVDGGRDDVSCMAMRQAASSTPPAAPRRWPVMDLVELMSSPFWRGRQRRP